MTATGLRRRAACFGEFRCEREAAVLFIFWRLPGSIVDFLEN
jgi:hypothetical protein